MAADGFERMLTELFGYQLFEAEPELEKLIGDTVRRYPRELGDEALEFVNAAGASEPGHEPPQLPEVLRDD